MCIQVPVNVDVMMSGRLRDNLLFCLQMYLVLPYYQTMKDPICFDCVLGDCCTKVIEIENNTNKTISYNIIYEGSQDFQIEELDYIRVEAKSSYKYKVFSILLLICQVTFVSRVTQVQTGRIWFASGKDGNNSIGAALAFDFKSKIKGRKSK